MANNLAAVAWWSTKPVRWNRVLPARVAAALAVAAAVTVVAAAVLAVVAATAAVPAVVAPVAVAAVVTAVAVAATKRSSSHSGGCLSSKRSFGAFFVFRGCLHLF